MLLSAAVRTTSELQLKGKCQFSHDGGRGDASDRCHTRSFLMCVVRPVIISHGCGSLWPSRRFYFLFSFLCQVDLRFSAQRERLFSDRTDWDILTWQPVSGKQIAHCTKKLRIIRRAIVWIVGLLGGKHLSGDVHSLPKVADKSSKDLTIGSYFQPYFQYSSCSS